MLTRNFATLLTTFVFALQASLSLAQSTSSSPTTGTAAAGSSAAVRGQLWDNAGKALAGVTLRLVGADGSIVAETKTDADGRFRFDSVGLGRYTVSSETVSITDASRALDIESSTPAEVSLVATPIATLQSVKVVAQRLDRARENLSPDIGADIYRFDRKDIQNLPLGDSTPLNQVLLQAPGVVQDSFGQLHVRGDHANLQYRVNGIIVPESVAGFGQTLSSRFAERINFMTGALPAQYGYRTAGVVDIEARGGALDEGGKLGYLGGSYQHNEGYVEAGGVAGDLTYFATGTALSDNLGIESPTPANTLHDHTTQAGGFGYFSYFLGNDTRLSLISGGANQQFQIPNIPGRTPQYTLAGAPDLASADLDQNQQEKNWFNVLALQGSASDKVDYQVALIQRYSSVLYQPDPVGDLIYTGVAGRIYRQNELYSLQGDLTYRLTVEHTPRAGIYVSRERAATDNTSLVFPADADGNQTSDVPITIYDDTKKIARLFGVYLQDEWKPTKGLTVNYGLRYDKVEAYVNQDQWSPRVGAVWSATAELTLHAGYASYFTPPPTEKILDTSVDKFQGTTNQLPSDANTSVSSERSHYFDAGLTYQWTPQFATGIDGYYRHVKDLQDEGQFGSALLFAPFNYQYGRIYGIDFTTSYREGNFSAYANLSVAKAEGKNIVSGQFNFDPAALDYIASHWVHLDHDQTVTASAGATYLWQGTTLTATLTYGSGLRSGFANTEHLPAYATVNAGAVRTFDWPGLGKLEVRLTVINLFDRVYELRDGTGIGVGAPQWGARRSGYVGIAKIF